MSRWAHLCFLVSQSNFSSFTFLVSLLCSFCFPYMLLSISPFPAFQLFSISAFQHFSISVLSLPKVRFKNLWNKFYNLNRLQICKTFQVCYIGYKIMQLSIFVMTIPPPRPPSDICTKNLPPPPRLLHPNFCPGVGICCGRSRGARIGLQTIFAIPGIFIKIARTGERQHFGVVFALKCFTFSQKIIQT